MSNKEELVDDIDNNVESKNNKKSGSAVIAILIGLILAVIIMLLLFKGCSKTEEYIVIFDTNGGTEISSVTVKENGTISIPKDPTKEGFTFDGWYYNDKKFDFDTKITKDMTLTAKWTALNNNIVLSTQQLGLALGENKSIEVLSLPDGVTKDNLVWSSSDETIATVDSNGNITPLKEGNVVITVKTSDGKYSTTCNVTISLTNKEVESVSITGSNEVTVGSTVVLSANFNPADATDKSVTWSSSNPSIATVDSNGNVKGLKPGTVTITVTTANGKTSTKNLTIREKKSNTTTSSKPTSNKVTTVNPTGVTISGTKTVYVGNTIRLTATVSPSNASNKKVTWTSSNPAIATVDQNGNVKGVKAGIVTITVKTANGKTATYKVTVQVKEPVYVIHLKAKEMAGTGAVTQYTFSVTKDGATFNDYKGFTYNGESIAKASGTMAASLYNKSKNTATLKLSDGTTKSATVIIG